MFLVEGERSNTNFYTTFPSYHLSLNVCITVMFTCLSFCGSCAFLFAGYCHSLINVSLASSSTLWKYNTKKMHCTASFVGKQPANTWITEN